ncbi:universal stress protein [Streptomyces sp. NPDC002577]
MPRPVTVGLDGPPESRAAAEWAAWEAKLCGLPLKVVHVWEPVPSPTAQDPLLGAETQQDCTEWVHRETAEGLRRCHTGVERGPLSAVSDEVLRAQIKAQIVFDLGAGG